ncbi:MULTISPECIES: class I SAM-dependent methyltransferase [Paenibacillus]|uniref:Methyltransferase domain-containing protein n=1 Tax=Paenibacillus campinasensis TaxID=66347 RepID=A0A268F073_9BACL|nr:MULTISPECIES: class I SAM-dependent methyltransferase [Paenibacillus]MUG65514.1 methyltransferase domain-containing protein [Paenibacillus campinasensis]PAD78787.1 SAM-dependent methyltransferase [Paenibacillus campinasensis]PAK53927.1 SAM-dependent methyltransferase [Paenibacillus sp. 7541]
MSISETVPWYEKSFGEDYLLVYRHRNQQEADQVVQQVLEWLKLPSGSQVLDLCCGAGRHALALANAGYRVTGVDLSSVLLRRARELDSEKRVRWVEADMRALPADDHFIENFDAVVNLFTSFGYFGADREQLDVLRQIRRALKPGGRFVMDVLNAGYIQDHLVPFSRREESGVIISERRQIHSGFVTKRIMIEDGDKEPRSYTERVKLYALKAMGSMLIDAGLVIDEVYGSYDGDAYHERYSPRMLIVGHRV